MIGVWVNSVSSAVGKRQGVAVPRSGEAEIGLRNLGEACGAWVLGREWGRVTRGTLKEESDLSKAQLSGELFEGGVWAACVVSLGKYLGRVRKGRSGLLVRSETQVFWFSSPVEQEAETRCATYVGVRGRS